MPTIHEAKRAEAADAPLLVFECTAGGQTYRWSTHQLALEAAQYEARVVRHNAYELRMGGDEGIDALARLSLTLANVDGLVSQVERSAGWKGAKLTVRFGFFHPETGEPASDLVTLFRGVANAPELLTDEVGRLSFVSRLSMSRVLLPDLRIQRRCGWTFPATRAERELVVLQAGERAYRGTHRCGYSADVAGGVGNLNGGMAFSDCDYTSASCRARGMFSQDAAGRTTARFGGCEFLPPAVSVRSHGASRTQSAAVLSNEAAYNDFVPLVYGTAWYRPPVIAGRNDGNLTRMEVLLGAGPMSGALKVLVNGTEIPRGVAGRNMTATGWWNPVSAGDKSGAFNLDFTGATGEASGDPHGSMAKISVVVPNRIADGSALPRVEVLAQGLVLPAFSEDGAPAGEAFTNNPAWVLLDVLRRSGWTLDELDVRSFARAAAYCGAVTGGQPRSECNLVLQRRRSAAEILRGVRTGAGLLLSFGTDGRLELRVEQQLAMQQPVKPEGSNATAPLYGGWPAYEFGDGTNGFSDILHGSVRLWSRPTAESPNRLSVDFQNARNDYSQDGLTLVEHVDVARCGHEVAAVLPALGIANARQATRALQLGLAKSVTGNLYIEFSGGLRSIGLRPGDLITVTLPNQGLMRQLFRILALAPGENHSTLRITAQIHREEWYAAAGPAGEGSNGASLEYGVPRPVGGTASDAEGRPQYGVEESWDAQEGLTLRVRYRAPARPGMDAPGAPRVSLAAAIAAQGGALRSGTSYYYGVTAVSGTGAEGDLSWLVNAVTAAGTHTARVTLQGLALPAGASSFRVYRGENPERLGWIADVPGTAVSFTDAGQSQPGAPPPDRNFADARLYWRWERVPESQCQIASASEVGRAGLGMMPNEHAGALVRITAGRGEGQERVVRSNTATTLQVATPWDIAPDATSRFSVADAGWQPGGTGSEGTTSVVLPGRFGRTVHILVRATSAGGRESASELGIVTRWQLGSQLGGAVDRDVPPAPSFMLGADYRGGLLAGGVSWPQPAHLRTIDTALVTVWGWDERLSPTPHHLTVALSAGTAVINVAGPATWAVGDVVQIGGEVMRVSAVLPGALQVVRAQFRTAAEEHPAQADVFRLTATRRTFSFPQGFFGSPAGANWQERIDLPETRVACASLVLVNEYGPSAAGEVNVTLLEDYGLRTLAGGQLLLQVPGYLAISDNAVPPVKTDRLRVVHDVYAEVNEAPQGNPVRAVLLVDGAAYGELVIEPGQTVSDSISGWNRAAWREGAAIGLRILSVGNPAAGSPGRDLTVAVRY